MIRKALQLLLICSIPLFGSGCGTGQQLVSIQVTPSGFVFEGVGAQGQFTALGTYIHPPETKDITTYYRNPSNPTNTNVIVGTATVKGVDDGTSKCMP